MKEVFFAIAILTPGLTACIPVCDVKEARCNGSIAELCDSNGRWQEVMDCDEVVGPHGCPWSCCLTDEGDGLLVPACLPATDCAGADR